MYSHQPRNAHPMALAAAALVTFLSILGSLAATGILPLPAVIDTALASAPFNAYHSLQTYSEAPAEKKPDTTENSPAEITMAAREARLCRICGVVESVQTMQIDGDAKIPGASVRNGVSVVPGSQKPLLSIIGGSAHAGHDMGWHLESSIAYVVKVRMADGTYRTITQTDRPPYAVGEAVKVVSGALTTA